MGHVSMRAARLDSLFFSVLLVVITLLLARQEGGSRLQATLAAFLTAASPLVTEHVSSTLSDIPSAALVWGGALAFFRARRRSTNWGWWAVAGALFALSILTKPTALAVIVMILGLALVRQRAWTNGRRGALAFVMILGPFFALVFFYLDHIRRGMPWRQFLYGWNASYSKTAASYWTGNLKNVRWFGVFLSISLVLALGSHLVARLRRDDPETRWRWWNSVVIQSALMAVVVWYAVWGSKGLTVPLREYGSGAWDRWMAGFPGTIAALVLFFLAARASPGFLQRLDMEKWIVLLGFSALWWWKLGYDRRFLILVLPVVTITCAGWIANVFEASAARDRPAIVVCIAILLISLGWEGARRMDSGFPVFSSHLVNINREHGLEPEAKLVAIFGDSARVVAELQRMLGENPHLRIVSPDNRLKFYFGTRLAAIYPKGAEDLRKFDILVWINNTGILEQYRQAYGILDPLSRLKQTGLLSPVMITAEYEVYRIETGR